MVNRCLYSSLLAIAAIIGLAPAEAQTAPATKLASAKKWTAPRTADGQPDLQGIWTNATITPFERPAALAGKAFFTEQEAAEFEAQAAKGRVDGPAKPGDVGSYNQAWSDGGTTVVSTRQTSLVVDPPDGRVPVKPWAEEKRAYDLAHVADSCVTRGFANHTNHRGHARAAIVRHIQSGSNLYHKIDSYFWMTSTRRHRFNLLSGRVSMMRTLSPAFAWFCSSCA